MEQLSLAGLGFKMSADEEKKDVRMISDLGETISGTKAMQLLELSSVVSHSFLK